MAQKSKLPTEVEVDVRNQLRKAVVTLMGRSSVKSKYYVILEKRVLCDVSADVRARSC